MELPFARMANPGQAGNFFIFSLRIHILRLKMYILRLEMHILSLEMNFLAGEVKFDAPLRQLGLWRGAGFFGGRGNVRGEGQSW